jgi:hypothetical protein
VCLGPVALQRLGIPAGLCTHHGRPGEEQRQADRQETRVSARPERSRLISVPDDRFLHTLLVTTSYRGGTIVPSYGMFYDWQGAFLFQPGVTLVRDPFRVVFDYTRVNAGLGSGQIAALRDRDNVRFQVEYVF